jgi:hypothetical protein
MMELGRTGRFFTAAATAAAVAFLLLSCSGDSGDGGKPAGDTSAGDSPKKGIVSDVTFRTLDGGERKISDYGRMILMVNFMETWNADSKKLIPIMNEVQRKFHANVVVLGVITDVQNTGQAAAFRKANDIKFEIVLPGEDTGWFGKPRRLPTTYVVTREDLIFDRFEGLQRTEHYEEYILAMYRRRM